ncbi:putative LOC100569746 [Trichonephila clavipes]|nr:putative LOC100569746 [Trichonephila clavipes]
MSDRGSLVFKVTKSCLVYHEFEPSTAEDPPAQRLKHVKSFEVWFGCYVKVVPAQVSPSSLNHGSKLLVESFFKNDEGHNVTVNGDRYRAMITNFFIPELNNHDVQELWFQQDGATCHTARATINLLKDTFGDRLISHFGPVNWPPRSCDLTPLDYFCLVM